MAEAGDEVAVDPNLAVQMAPLDPLASLAMVALEGSLAHLWKDQWTGNPNTLEEALQEAEAQWAPFNAANYDAMAAFNDAFLAVLGAKPQLLMQVQNTPEVLFTMGKGPTLVSHRFMQGQQGNRGVLFARDWISGTAPFPMYQLQGQMPNQHEYFARIGTGQSCLPMWAEVSDAFQEDDTLQVLDLINEPQVDATSVSKALFVPKYVATFLPGCYMGHQLFDQLAAFWLLLTEAHVDRLEPLFQYRLGAVTHENVAGTRLTQGPSCDLIQVVEEPVMQIYDSILQGLIPAEAAAAPAGATAAADPTMVEVVQLALQEAHGEVARAPAAGSLTKLPFDEQELTFLLRFYGEPLSEFHWEGYPILETIAGIHQSKATKEVVVHHL
jgi:hypothetical protein